MSDSRYERQKKYAREYYNRNKEKIKNRQKKYDRKRNYGLDTEQWNELFIKQNSRCAICKSLESGKAGSDWATDHCHITNKVRGILCHRCNLAIGMFKDNILILQSAIEYLSR